MRNPRHIQFVGQLWYSMLLAFIILTSFTTAKVVTAGNKETTIIKKPLGNKANIVKSNNQNVCHSKECLEAANNILKRMNKTIDPCEDFERFACGAYKDKIMKTAGNAAINSKIVKKLRKFLEENIAKEDFKGTKLVKNYYRTCMDTDRIEKRGLAPLQDILAKLGGWPVVEGDNWDSANYQWTKNLYKMRELGYSPNVFFILGFSPDFENSTRNILHIKQIFPYMKREDLLNGFNNSNIQAYYEMQLGLATLLGADRKRAERELKELIEFDAEIAKINSPPDEDRKSFLTHYNKMTLNDLQMLAPDLPWFEFTNKMLSPYFSVNASEPIRVYAKDSLKKVSLLIKNTPKRILANYIIWDVVRKSIPFLNEAVLNLKFEYVKKVKGVQYKKSRWWSCISKVRSEFAVSSYYIRNYFTEDAKNTSKDIYNSVHEAFYDKLQSLSWLDDATRKVALEKTNSMHSSIAYPGELLNDAIIKEYYDGLIITKDDYFEQGLNWKTFHQQKGLKKFRTKIDRRNWENYGEATLVDAFYHEKFNSIEITAGVLQGENFNAVRPMYLNYGAIGMIMGHIITHGFKAQARQLDASGELNNWWGSATERKYQEKALCFIEQYNNSTEPLLDLNLQMSGKSTLGEYIADNGGIKDAYFGYKKWIKHNREDPLLPGLPYTQNQLFWVSAANNLCSLGHPNFSINSLLINNVDFSKDFECSVESPMNPKNKCELW